MKLVSAAVLAMLTTVSMQTFAAPPKGYVDGFYVADAQIDDPDLEGDGFGAKGAFSLAERVFLTGEYQDVSYDDVGVDLSQLRFGAGYRAPIGGSTLAFVQAEYLDIDLEVDGAGSADDSGYGVHAGLRGENGRLGVTVKVGYLDVADLDGVEYEIEADYRFSDWIGAFAGYRVSDLSGDDDAELKLQDLRVGLSVYLGG